MTGVTLSSEVRSPSSTSGLRTRVQMTGWDPRIPSRATHVGGWFHLAHLSLTAYRSEPRPVRVKRQVSRRSSHWRRLQLRRTYILRARRRFAPNGPRFPPELDWGILESRRVSLDAREGEAWLRAGPPEGSRGGVDGEGDRFAQGAAALSRRRGHPSLTRYSTYLQFTLMLCLVGEKRGKNIIANCVEKCVYESKE